MTIFTPIATYLLYFYLSLPDSHICPQNKDSLPSNSPVCALYSGDCPSSPSKFCQVSFSSAQEACQDANVIAYIEGQCAELTLQTCQPGMPEASSLGDKACSFSALRRLGGFSQDVAMNDVAIAEVCKSELAGFLMQGDCSELEETTKHICTNSKANKINGADSDICVYYTGDDCEGKVCRRTENAEGLICKDDSVLFYTEGACKESVKQDEMLLLDQDEAINVVEPEKPKEDEEWDLSNDVPEVREEVQPDGTILLVPLAPRHSKPDEVLDLGNDVPEVEAEELSDGTIKFNPKSSVYEPEEPELHDEVDNTEPILMDVKEEGFPPQEPELHDEVDNTEPVLMDVKEKGFPPKEPELHDEVDNTEPVLQDVQEKGFEPEVLPTQEKEIICKVVQVKAEVQPNGDILLTPIESEKPEELKAPEEPELHDEVDNTEPILMDVKEEGFPPQEPELHDEVDNTKPVLMDVKEEGFPPQEPEPELYDEVDNTEPVLMDVKEEGFPPQEPELKDKLDVTEPALVDVQEKGFEPEKLPPQEKEVHDKVVETQAEVQPNGDILLTPVDAEKPEILDFKAEEPKPVVKLENPLDIMGIEPKEADATISNGKVIYSMDSAIEPEEKR